MLGRLLGARSRTAASQIEAAIGAQGDPVGADPADPADGPAREVIIRRGRWLPALSGRLSGMGRSAAAVTLGRTIVVHPSIALSPRLLRHELAHVRQWQRQPLTFAVRYLLAHLRHGYRNNPYEVKARSAE